ncbi:hypothetical protein HPB50_028334 [Hyalomma asiaticum]|nr:hypothetical protein HPB50_028334 [Hyalomma asiaticum]
MIGTNLAKNVPKIHECDARVQREDECEAPADREDVYGELEQRNDGSKECEDKEGAHDEIFQKKDEWEELSPDSVARSCQDEEQSSYSLLPFQERRERVRQVLAHAKETLDGMRRDASDIFPPGECFATVQCPAPTKLKPSGDVSALVSLISQLNQDAVGAETDHDVHGDHQEDSLDPCTWSRCYIVVDEIDAINDSLLPWRTAAYAQLGTGLRKRLGQPLAKYRRFPERAAAVPREKLLNDTTEGRRHLVTDTRADLHAACADFDKWRTEYLKSAV